jgi:tape measure domain-containing protein
MAGAVSNLMVRAGFDGSQLTRGLQQMQGEVRGAQSSISSTLGTVGKVTAAAVAAAGAALIALGGYVAKVGISYDQMQENSQVAWTTLLGSQEKAKQQLKEIADFAKNTQFDTEGVDAMAKYMFNAGLSGKGLMDELTRIADVSGAFNISAADAKELARQMSQVDQAGVAYTEDLNILQDRGVPIYKAIAKELGTNVAAVRKMASQGQITSDIYNKAFNEIAKTVQGSADKQSKTFTGMISTLKDDFSIISGILAKPIFNALHDGLTRLMPLMDGLTSLARGDMNAFKQSLESTFGKTGGELVLNFIENFKQGFSQISSIIDKIKPAFQVLFDFVKGDNIQAIDLLTKMGIPPKLVVDITNVIVGIKTAITTFFNDYTNYIQNLFSGKNNLVDSFMSMFNTVKSIVMPILQDIVNFIGSEFGQIKQWWDTYGGQITQAVQNFWAVIAAIFKALAPVILFILQSVWDNIKGIIQGAVNIIEGIILVFTGIFTGHWSTLWQGIKDILGGAVEVIWNVINLMFIAKLLKGIGGFFELIKSVFSGGWTSIVNGLKLFVSDAGTWFATFLDTATTKFSAIVDAAKNIPSGIVSGLQSGIKAVGDAIMGVANEIVKKFKEALGIHSPSKVFAEMGGHIISGLANGLTSGNLLDLGKAVFKDFGGGIFNTVDKIKGYLTGAFSGSAGGSVAGWLQSALSIVGAPSSWLGPLSTLVQKESGGNPAAINLWDSNAKAGHPSKGLFQTIDSTFSAYAIKGLGDIYNPIANAVAGIRYIMDRYGSVYNVPGIKSMLSGGAYRGYASGTNSAIAGWHLVGENGPELMYTPGGSVIKNNRDTNKLLGGANKTYNVTVNSLQANMDEKDLVRALQRMEALNYA